MRPSILSFLLLVAHSITSIGQHQDSIQVDGQVRDYLAKSDSLVKLQQFEEAEAIYIPLGHQK